METFSPLTFLHTLAHPNQKPTWACIPSNYVNNIRTKYIYAYISKLYTQSYPQNVKQEIIKFLDDNKGENLQHLGFTEILIFMIPIHYLRKINKLNFLKCQNSCSVNVLTLFITNHVFNKRFLSLIHKISPNTTAKKEKNQIM